MCALFAVILYIDTNEYSIRRLDVAQYACACRHELPTIAELAIAHDLWVVADEVYGAAGFTQEAACAARDHHDAVTADVRATYRQTGVSVLDAQAFGPSAAGFLRLGLVVGDEQLAEACRRIKSFVVSAMRQGGG